LIEDCSKRRRAVWILREIALAYLTMTRKREPPMRRAAPVQRRVSQAWESSSLQSKAASQSPAYTVLTTNTHPLRTCPMQTHCDSHSEKRLLNRVRGSAWSMQQTRLLRIARVPSMGTLCTGLRFIVKESRVLIEFCVDLETESRGCRPARE